MSNQTNQNQSALATQLIAGAKKHFPAASSLAYGGGTHTPAQIETSLQAIIDLLSAVGVAKAAYQAKLAEWKAQSTSLRSQAAAFEAFVKVTFGNSPDVLADFGLKPEKVRTPLTASQKVAAAAKRAATRAARHTMGSQQKKSVKGTITTIVTPALSPAAPPIVTGGGGASVPATPGTNAAAAPRVTTP